MLYSILQKMIGLGLRMYYSEIKVINREMLAHDGPKIIICNHPNTLIDAWLIGTQLGEPAYFITKGVFFNSKWKKKMLRSLNMIPINRAGESRTSGVENKDTFEECYRLLGEGKTIVIFPEGTSTMELQLRELKTGTARIALEAEKRYEGKLNLKVIPVGLLYTQGEKFRSKILIQAGKGVFVNHYLEEYEANSSQASRQLTNVFRSMLEKVLVTTQNLDQENMILSLEKILKSKYRNPSHDVQEDVQFTKQIRDRMELLHLVAPWKVISIQKKMTEVEWMLDRLEIQSDFLDRRWRTRMFLRQILFSIIGILIGLPVYLYGLIHNIIPYLITDWSIPKITKDKEYYAPLGILLGLFLYPLMYFSWILLAHHFCGLNWWQLSLYFVSLPISGMLAYHLAKYMRHIAQKARFIFKVFFNKTAVMELKENKEVLYNMVFED